MRTNLRKKIVYPFVALILISLIVISIIMSAYGFDKIKIAIHRYPLVYLFIAFFIYLSRWFVESIAFKISTGKFKKLTFLQCLKTVIATQFMNMITPFMSGGQPATLLLFTQFGLDIPSSFSAMFIKSMMYQFFLSLFGFIAFISLFNTLDNVARNAALIGILINLIIVTGLLVIGLSHSIARKIIGFFLSLLKKIKIIRLKEETEASIFKSIEKFNRSFKQFRHEKKRLFFLFLITGFQFTLFNLCAYVILNGFGDFNNFNNFARIVLINTSALIVPTPGNSGGAEGLYALFLGSVLNEGKMGAGLLMWRFIVFYIPVIITGIMTFFIFMKLYNQQPKRKKEVSL